MSALATIQAAMRERLTAEFDVSVLVSDRIYDGEAPQGAALPYVVIGSATEDDAGPLGRAGYRDTLMLHV